MCVFITRITHYFFYLKIIFLDLDRTLNMSFSFCLYRCHQSFRRWDLQTLGMIDYDKRLTHSFTAHPKVDPVTGKSSIFFCERRELLFLLTHDGLSRSRWNVYIWLFAYATISHIPSDLERWYYAWPCSNYYIRANHDAWFCNYRELLNLHGSSYALQAKGTH